jgi:hypothetical protein
MVLPFSLRWNKLLFRWNGLFLTVVTSVGCSRAAASTPSAEGPMADAGGESVAVVELFTSEGCSSCPPADDVLRDLAVEASRTGRRVYPLAFHVDYWNSLGWPDPYSSGLATNRQQAYGRALGQRGVYTPEMVVNGRDAFVGSDRSRARRSIESALSRPEASRIVLRATRDDHGVSVDFTFSAAPARGSVLQVALVQVEALTHVNAGENAGRTLHHANVVRGFQTLRLDGLPSGHVTFAPSSPLQGSSGEAIIAFLQNPQTMAIGAAARVDL